MAIKNLVKVVNPKILASAASADYTQVWTQIFSAGNCNRVSYWLIAHASITLVKFSIQIATDASGTSAADVGTTHTTAAAGKLYTIDIVPSVLTATKTYVSPLVDVSAGTYTLIEVKYDLRNPGNYTADATFPTAVFNS